jgi:hypothetical protein
MAIAIVQEEGLLEFLFSDLLGLILGRLNRGEGLFDLSPKFFLRKDRLGQGFPEKVEAFVKVFF